MEAKRNREGNRLVAESATVHLAAREGCIRFFPPQNRKSSWSLLPKETLDASFDKSSFQYSTKLTSPRSFRLFKSVPCVLLNPPRGGALRTLVGWPASHINKCRSNKTRWGPNQRPSPHEGFSSLHPLPLSPSGARGQGRQHTKVVSSNHCSD
jgi:hypothetical protein